MIIDFQHISICLLAMLVIAIVVMIIYNRIYYRREKDIDTRTSQLNTQLALVLDSNKTQIWTFDPMKRIFVVLQEGNTGKEYTPLDFAQFFNHDDFNHLRQFITTILNGEKESGKMKVSSREEEGKPTLTYEIHVSVLRRDREGTPSVLLGIQRDTTEDVIRQEESRRLSLRYHTVFDSSLVDMVFYNEDGILTDINNKALESFGVKDREALIKRNVKISDIPSYRDIDFEHLENAVLSSITDIDKTKQTDERIPEVTIGGKHYYEVTLSTLRDEQNNLHGIITAGRNITEMVLSHHSQQKKRKLLKDTTKEIETYITNINYTLRASGVRIFHYYPNTHQLDISSDLNKVQYSLSQIRCASLIDPSDRRRLRGLFLRMDHRRQQTFTTTFHTIFHDEQKRCIHLTFSAVPVTNEEGTIIHYFGLCRNDTETVYTEARLREETEKAQETESLKDAFLTNMSYEIRTPLNAVVGFAGLYNAPHDEADETVFADEIKRNTGRLLQLVNDILFLSKLDARMVEFNYQDSDFAALFEGYCYMGWSNVSPGVTVSAENPYNHLIVKIDEKNLCEVVQKLCEHAARNTTEGTIRAKYEYRHGELSISIEDTGRGISSEILSHLFDRFTRNESTREYDTGLDMPIIKELVEQMGGTIEIQSEEGKGTTAYVIIPCEMRSMEKKELEGVRRS
jgi:PAS domain S-box-containing protein